MINPIRLTEDIFDEKDLSNDNLRNFTEDFLLRLVLPANNPGGIYNGMVTDTTLLYNAFYGKMSSEGVAISIREGLTVGKDNARIVVTEKLSNLQNLVAYKFGKGSGIYQEFYPQGMDEYHQSKQDDLKLLLDRFLTAATTHLTANYPDDVTEVTTKINNYKNSLNLKISTVGEIDTLKTGRREDRKALTRKMSLNFLQLAIDHFENPDAFDNYYNPSYLPLRSTDSSGETLSYESTAPGGISVLSPNFGEPVTITEATKLKITHLGENEQVLSFYLSDADNQPPMPPQVLILEPGDSKSVTMSQLGFPKTFFLVQNSNPIPARYRIEIVED